MPVVLNLFLPARFAEREEADASTFPTSPLRLLPGFALALDESTQELRVVIIDHGNNTPNDHETYTAYLALGSDAHPSPAKDKDNSAILLSASSLSRPHLASLRILAPPSLTYLSLSSVHIIYYEPPCPFYALQSISPRLSAHRDFITWSTAHDPPSALASTTSEAHLNARMLQTLRYINSGGRRDLAGGIEAAGPPPLPLLPRPPAVDDGRYCLHSATFALFRARLEASKAQSLAFTHPSADAVGAAVRRLSAAADRAGGVLVGLGLILHAKVLARALSSTGLRLYTSDLPALFAWLAANPGGIKVHAQLSQGLAALAHTLLHASCTFVRSYTAVTAAMVPGIVAGLAVALGLSAALAFLHDLLLLAAAPLFLLHFLYAALYAFVLQCMAFTWRLVRGERPEALRRRIHAVLGFATAVQEPAAIVSSAPSPPAFATDALIVGVLLFTSAAFLLPTLFLFHASATALAFLALVAASLVAAASAALLHLGALAALCLRLAKPSLFPGMLTMEVEAGGQTLRMRPTVAPVAHALWPVMALAWDVTAPVRVPALVRALGRGVALLKFC